MEHETFYFACFSGDATYVDMCLKNKVDPNSANGLGVTVLHAACAKAHVEIVRLLLAAGADPNLHIGEMPPPLIVAAEKGCVETVRMLLQAGARVNVIWRKRSALHSVCYRFNFHCSDFPHTMPDTTEDIDCGRIFGLLVNAGSNLEHRDQLNRTTLMILHPKKLLFAYVESSERCALELFVLASLLWG